jgi:intracellular sulfur oxidation DsrE/DsrF family protein
MSLLPANRRHALATMAASVGAMASLSTRAAEPAGATLVPLGAKSLQALSHALANAPRRRDFKSVPMILTKTDEWDADAVNLVLAYGGTAKQAFDNTEIDGPWLNLMRNSMNAQVWSWKHPDFLCVSATHGSAHLALYDDYLWDKYQLAKLTQGKFERNTLAKASAAADADAADFQKADGAFSPQDNSIAALQRRGAVFIACHNAIWEISGGRIKAGVNPDHLTQQAMAAEFSNHLIDGVVLSPGAIGTLPELQRAGFAYAK